MKSTYLVTLDNGDVVFTVGFSNGDTATLTVTIDDASSLTPTTGAFSKAAPADVTSTVYAPSGVTVESIAIGETEVTQTDNWGVADGTLTLESAYLATLTNGDTAFTATFSNGDTATLTVTIGD